MSFVHQVLRSGPLRVVLALAAMAPMASFMLGSGGGCIMYYHDNFAVVLLVSTYFWLGRPLLFIVGFAWLVAELIHPLLSNIGAFRARSAMLAAIIGLTVYAAVGLAIWLQSPIPEEFRRHERDSGRLYASIYWPIGIRVLDGTTSKYTCGQ